MLSIFIIIYHIIFIFTLTPHILLKFNGFIYFFRNLSCAFRPANNHGCAPGPGVASPRDAASYAWARTLLRPTASSDP